MKMPNSASVLDPVLVSLDRLVSIGERYDGLLPSILDRHTGEQLPALPEAIPGQRNGDRCLGGSNLIHDESTLLTLFGLGEALGRTDYQTAADRYLHRFATHCTDTVTGLFPWGEHSFWHLAEDRVGDSLRQAFPDRQDLPVLHDHLRQAPLWLWKKLHTFHPRCVERFAEGLDFHWLGKEREEYIRHAAIDRREYLPRGKRSCDFPRHSGFYILDWAFAWFQTGRPEFLDQLRVILDYWWEKRDRNALLLIESRSPADSEEFHGVNAPGQTLSLAVSLLETADLVAEKDSMLAALLRQRAEVYTNGFLAAPHDPSNGIFALSCRQDDNSLIRAMPVWGSEYGVWPASYIALTCLCGYRLTEDRRLLDWAVAVGNAHLIEPFPENATVPAMDAGLGIGLLADLFDLTREEHWLQGALRLGADLAGQYLDAPLPRGAAGIDWYESQMGPGFLLHGLARTALLAENSSGCPLPPDYTAR